MEAIIVESYIRTVIELIHDEVCVLQTAIGANGSNILAIPFEFRQLSWR